MDYKDFPKAKVKSQSQKKVTNTIECAKICAYASSYNISIIRFIERHDLGPFPRVCLLGLDAGNQ